MIGSPYYVLDWVLFRQVMEMQAGKTVTGGILCTSLAVSECEALLV